MLGDMQLSDASAVVTGGASGIGAGVARRLAAEGARVVIADVQTDKGEAVAAEIGGIFAQVDVTDSDQIQAAVERAEEAGPLRALVSCAGIGIARRTIGRDGEYASAHPIDAFTKVLSINVVGTFDAIRHAATAMSRLDPTSTGERGAIVTIASIAAYDGQIGQAAYSASKGGIVGMTLPIARDLAAVGIRVNTVAPGLIDTPIYEFAENAEKFKAKLAESVLFPRRLGTADELASIVLECLTNSYMNAEVVRLDGGIRLPPK
jgi:NAD(P)-dependent dehydrogenase (short-subunit alcohol dehydrogenase family)